MARRRLGSASFLSVSRRGFCHAPLSAAAPLAISTGASPISHAQFAYLFTERWCARSRCRLCLHAAAVLSDLHLSPPGRNDEISHSALCKSFAPAALREISQAQKLCFLTNGYFCLHRLLGPNEKIYGLLVAIFRKSSAWTTQREG
jgi:hypothetical protein